jgi:iron uptake system EfeUOB component EfeO/EfeM
MWPALAAVGAALAAFLLVGALRGGAARPTSAGAEPAAVVGTVGAGPVPAAEYEEQAPHVFSHLWIFPPQGRRQVTPTLPPDHPVVAAARFARPEAEYVAYSRAQLAALTGPLGTLRGALAAGDRAGAERAWEVAWAGYLHLGAVYLQGPVSDLNDRIDGVAGGIPGGTASPDFTGFHRLEYGLWTGASPQSLLGTEAGLQRDITALRAALPKADITPLDYATRAHEILEDAQRDLLSGTQVPWSQQGVLGTAAGIVATREVLRTLQPLLITSVPGTELNHLQAVLAGLATAHGGTLPSNRQLTQAQAEQLNAALGETLEALAQIPGLLETAAAPSIPLIPRSAVRIVK